MEHIAEQGKIWHSKREGWYGSHILQLAPNDTLDDYEQVDKPIETEPENDEVEQEEDLQ